MRSILRKSGFTLMEVNLAVFIMAAGVLAMISLYPLAYRENSQSVEDVKAAAYADAAFNQIAGVLSAYLHIGSYGPLEKNGFLRDYSNALAKLDPIAGFNILAKYCNSS